MEPRTDEPDPKEQPKPEADRPEAGRPAKPGENEEERAGDHFRELGDEDPAGNYRSPDPGPA